MSFKTVISVIIPIYNRPELASKAIQSALTQVGDFRVEVIAVDDGSTDDSANTIAQRFDTDVRVLRQPNLGACAARNNGIDNARGEYIAFLDSDDCFLPGHLQRALKIVSVGPRTATYARVVMDRGADIKFFKPARALGTGESVAEYLLCEGGFIPTPTLVMATEIAKSVRYKEGLRNGQDIDFAIRLQLNDVSIKMIEQPGAIVQDQFSPERISTTSNTDNRLSWLLQMEPEISSRAAWGYRGWLLAKSYAQDGRYIAALREYGGACMRGVYSPRLSVRVLIQILLPKRAVVRIKDALAKFKGRF